MSCIRSDLPRCFRCITRIEKVSKKISSGRRKALNRSLVMRHPPTGQETTAFGQVNLDLPEHEMGSGCQLRGVCVQPSRSKSNRRSPVPLCWQRQVWKKFPASFLRINDLTASRRSFWRGATRTPITCACRCPNAHRFRWRDPTQLQTTSFRPASSGSSVGRGSRPAEARSEPARSRGHTFPREWQSS
jgi:hypothetical protein